MQNFLQKQYQHLLFAISTNIKDNYICPEELSYQSHLYQETFKHTYVSTIRIIDDT